MCIRDRYGALNKVKSFFAVKYATHKIHLSRLWHFAQMFSKGTKWLRGCSHQHCKARILGSIVIWIKKFFLKAWWTQYFSHTCKRSLGSWKSEKKKFPSCLGKTDIPTASQQVYILKTLIHYQALLLDITIGRCAASYRNLAGAVLTRHDTVQQWSLSTLIATSLCSTVIPQCLLVDLGLKTFHTLADRVVLFLRLLQMPCSGKHKNITYTDG